MTEPAPIYYRSFNDENGSWYEAAGIAARTPKELAERLQIPRDHRANLSIFATGRA
jgi:hypothetical protein